MSRIKIFVDNSNLLSISTIEHQDLLFLQAQLPSEDKSPLSEEEKQVCINWNIYLDKLLAKQGSKGINVHSFCFKRKIED